jgi:hypothetical protein
MKIAHTDLALHAQHQRTESRAARQTLQAGATPSVRLQLSDRARQARPETVPGLALGRPTQRPAQPSQPTPPNTAATATEGPQDPAGQVEPRLAVLARMIEVLTGEVVRIFRAEALQGEGSTSAALSSPATANTTGATTGGANTGWQLSFQQTEIRYEREVTQFAAQGTVQTADGRTLTFSLGLTLQREFLEVRHTALQASGGNLKDPLVLHFDGALPHLTSTRFDFDIDADGRTEALPFVGAGSGFLVWDRNANGQADDGRELFGALSGDGFAELAAHDQDGNGWIDEADAIFAQLRVWQQDASGQDRLRSLTEAGVGALHLGRVATPFSLRDGQQATLGEVRSSGVYLSDNGRAGVLQQIDLSV